MKILTIRALKIWFFIKIWLLLFVLVGCAPGDKLIFRPDVYISGNFGYNRPYYYGVYYLYSDIVVKNGTPYRLEVEISGAGKFNLIPGQKKEISVRVDYRERRDVILTATAFTADEKIYGTTHKRISFHGYSYEKRVELWHIHNWDIQSIRDP